MELLVPFLKRLGYDAVLDWGLNPGLPALKASTLPLGYRGLLLLICNLNDVTPCIKTTTLRHASVVNIVKRSLILAKVVALTRMPFGDHT